MELLAKPVLSERLLPLSMLEAEAILKDHASGDKQPSLYPPVKPKAGEVYCIAAEDPSKLSI